MSLKVKTGHVFIGGGREDRYSISIWDGNRFNGLNNPLGYLNKEQLKRVRDEINNILKEDDER